MKKFVLKTLAFLLETVVAAGLIVPAANVVVLRNSRIEPGTEVVVIGDSTTATAIDDSRIPGTVNVSRVAESYFYTYAKTRVLIRNRPESLRTLVVSIAPHNLKRSIEARWLFNPAHMGTRLADYAVLLSPDQWRLLLGDPSAVIRAVPNLVGTAVRTILQDVTGLGVEPRIGSYTPLTASGFVEAEGVDPPATGAPADDDREEISAVELDYLRRTVDVATAAGLRVALLNTPKHATRVAKSQLSPTVSARVSDVRYVNCTRFPIPDSGFADAMHLNRDGAAVFSDWIARTGWESVITRSVCEPQAAE